MTRLTAPTLMALTLTGLLASVAAASAQNLTPIAAPPAIATTSLAGQAVFDQNGARIGEIKDVLHSSDGRGDFAVVRGPDGNRLYAIGDLTAAQGHDTLRPGAMTAGF